MLRNEDLEFTTEDFANRRRKLMDQIGPDSLIIIPGAAPQNRNADNDHPFRQDSNFYYLTGFNEPLAIAVLIPGRAEGEYILFNRAHNPGVEKFTGLWAGQDGAVNDFKANASYDIESFEQVLYPLFKTYKNIHYRFGNNRKFFFNEECTGPTLKDAIDNCIEKRSNEILNRSARSFDQHDPSELIHRMRLIKEPKELAVMQQAINISLLGHMRAMQAGPEDKHNEMTISAEFHHEIMHHDTQEVAYPTIAGAGAHGCVLHYQQNNGPIKKDELMLLDAGAEFKMYASDITRTFPVQGHFTPEQRAIYELVETTQQICIDAAKPGVTLTDIHLLSAREITKGLIKLGILQGDLEQLIEQKACQAYYKHGVGHWLGLDVHDTSIIRAVETPFAPNMVFTIEPGIYIDKLADLDPKWRDIPVRIEDDIVITETGCRVLSEALPRKADLIESIMQGWVPPAMAQLGYKRLSMFAQAGEAKEEMSLQTKERELMSPR